MSKQKREHPIAAIERAIEDLNVSVAPLDYRAFLTMLDLQFPGITIRQVKAALRARITSLESGAD